MPYSLEGSGLIKMYNCLPYLNEYIIWETVMGFCVASTAIQVSIVIEFSFAMEFSCGRVIITFNKCIPFRDLWQTEQHPLSCPTKVHSIKDHSYTSGRVGTLFSQTDISPAQSKGLGEITTWEHPGRVLATTHTQLLAFSGSVRSPDELQERLWE